MKNIKIIIIALAIIAFGLIGQSFYRSMQETQERQIDYNTASQKQISSDEVDEINQLDALDLGLDLDLGELEGLDFEEVTLDEVTPEKITPVEVAPDLVIENEVDIELDQLDASEQSLDSDIESLEALNFN
jgi:hypothetical protein